MKFFEEQTWDEFYAQEPKLLAIVYNNVVGEYRCVVLNKDEMEKYSSSDICKYVQSRYSSKFDDHELDVAYYERIERHLL